MTYTEIKQRAEKKYYYRVKSVRKGEKVDKERVYLGEGLGKQDLARLEKEADGKLLKKSEPIIEKEKKKEEKDIKGITAGKDEFSDWFTQIMLKADLADYTDVSGSIVFKPTAYSIWEKIKQECDKRLKEIGVKNVYFPLLIPEKLFNKEQEHVEGFSPEVAWVTQTGNTTLSERLAIRPTSEAIMYPSYAKWIRSYKDLPLKLNQWNNVIRWEFKHPVPFLRTREFLWNEGHSAFSSKSEALEEEKPILEMYKDVCENTLALYGEIGRKTEKEKFAGAVFSEKLHYIMPNGKAIEGPCFHHDGQNFAKAYDIKFLDKNEKQDYVWQNTYAITTRMLGVMFAVHSDSRGLILPPKVALNQIVIVPIFSKGNKQRILNKAREIQKELQEYNPIFDDREDYHPGFKFNEYELKGIPIRVEIGKRDIDNGEIVVARRDTGKKESVKFSDIKTQIPKTLTNIQDGLFKKSEELYKSKLAKADTLEELKKIIDSGKMVLSPMCKSIECEDMMKFKTGGAKTIFINKKQIKNEKCIICNKPADYFVYLAKSY